MTKYYYKYNPNTFEYLESQVAYLDPEETKIQGKNVYSLPAWATFDKPLKTKKNEVNIFDIDLATWKIEHDYRGMYQVNEDMQPEEVLNFGELPEGYIPITEAQANKIIEDPLYYIIQDGELIINPDYDEQKLAIAKQDKYDEANYKANYFLDSEALFELYPDFHIEATKEHISIFAIAADGIERGIIPYQEWTSKEDNKRQLNAEECLTVSFGIGAIQNDVWNNQYYAYNTAIDEAQTVADVERIVINYVI